MNKANHVSWQNVVLYFTILLAVATSFYAVRPRHYVSLNAPVFLMGEEVKVQQGVKPEAVTVVGQRTAVLAAPAPRTPAAPLPIIPPSIAARVLPDYPAAALAKNVEGAVLLSVYVGMTGQPEKIVTHTSSGNADLDGSAIKAVSQWKFHAATQGGQSRPSWFEVPVRFVIK